MELSYCSVALRNAWRSYRVLPACHWTDPAARSALHDSGSVESAVAQPRMSFGGVKLYPTIESRATALCFSLIMNHPFVDGNKRIGHAAMETFLVMIIVEPFRHLGGMHGGGIRIQQDCLYLEDIGGIARELHDADYALPGGGSTNQWQARQMIRKKVEDAGIRFFTEHRLDSRDDVVKDGTTIEMIHLNYAPIMDEGVPPPKPTKRKAFSVKAKVFIDASYEGDLMAFSGCGLHHRARIEVPVRRVPGRPAGL